MSCERETLSEKHRQLLFKPLKIIPNPKVMNIKKITNFFPRNLKYGKQIVSYKVLDEYDEYYTYIQDMFKDSFYLKIDKIVKVYNPYLKKAFELKRSLHFQSAPHYYLFHGTKGKYVQNICEHNFNWRYSGREHGHRLGKGVNFTTDPSFASIFCDRGSYKVIILAEVLIKQICTGHKKLVVPSPGIDTAGSVTFRAYNYVKFEDNEFYPSFIIYCYSEEL